MKTRTAAARLAIAGLLLALLLGACGSDDTSTTATTAQGKKAGDTATVDIRGSAFSPETVTVSTGGDVTWINHDDFAHKILFPDDGPKSDDLGKDATFTAAFPKAGTFDYVCGIHGSMKGTITVL